MSLRDDAKLERAKADSQLVRIKDELERILADLRGGMGGDQIMHRVINLRTREMVEAVMTLGRAARDEAAARAVEAAELREANEQALWKASQQRLAKTYESAPWLAEDDNKRATGRAAACADP